VVDPIEISDGSETDDEQSESKREHDVIGQFVESEF
jgi:hypothetical protein